jgi:hypothetical protein
MTADSVTVRLVNVNPVEERTVIVEGGAYAEHQLTRIELDDYVVPVQSSAVGIRLAPGCGDRLTIAMDRYANPPTLAFPWDRA